MREFQRLPWETESGRTQSEIRQLWAFLMEVNHHIFRRNSQLFIQLLFIKGY